MLEDKLDRISEQLAKIKQNNPPTTPPRSHRSRPPADERESEIPEELLASLDSHRSSQSGHGGTTVYHVTINQPRHVNIGAQAMGGRAGTEVVKNVRVNDDFDHKLNLKTGSRPGSPDSQGSSVVMKETGAMGRHPDSDSEGSFEGIEPRGPPRQTDGGYEMI
jgi:hypothetical protein